MRLLPLLVLLSLTSAEFWTVHINAKLKCFGKFVKERLHYELTDTNFTRFDRALRTATRGRTHSQGWLVFSATKKYFWVPLLTIYHRCGSDKNLQCYKTASIPIPREVMSLKLPRAFNLTGDGSYLDLGKLPSYVIDGADCSYHFARSRGH